MHLSCGSHVAEQKSKILLGPNFNIDFEIPTSGFFFGEQVRFICMFNIQHESKSQDPLLFQKLKIKWNI